MIQVLFDDKTKINHYHFLLAFSNKSKKAL